MCGIYKITNLITNKSYIGQSLCIEERWKKHRNYPTTLSHYPLYQAFAKYGMENFSFEVLEECLASDLNIKEMSYIKLYDTYHNGYNQTEGGEGQKCCQKLSQEDVAIIYDLLAHYPQITQREIANCFSVGEDTISEINQGKTRIDLTTTYPIRNNRREKHYCEKCGKELSRGATLLCNQCSHEARRVAERPSRDELKSCIRNMPFTKIGEKYGVSDNTIRKWCISYNLPSKKKDIKIFSDEEWLSL